MLVTNRSEFQRAFDTLWSYRSSGFIVDTETTGLEMFARENPARMCSIQIAPMAAPDRQWYFPYRHGEGVNLDMDTLQGLRDLLRGTVWLGHNIGFDVKILMCDGFDRPTAIFDSRIASQLANENEKNSEYGRAYSLKKLCAQYFGEDTITASVDLKAELRKRKLSVANDGLENLWRLPAEVVYQYGVDDLKLTHRLHEYQLEVIRRWRMEEAYVRKCKAQMAATRMEQRGVLLDTHEVDRQMSLLGPRIDEIVAEITQLSGGANLNSPAQLCTWLGLPKTDKKFLEALIDANPQGVNPAFRTLLEYREIKKAASAYFKPFKEKMDAGGRLHCNFNIGGARTGRYSSSGPNMQNCSKDRRSYSLKRCFVAAPGKFLFEADYSSLEPRVGAFFTKDPSAIEVFKNGLDYYKPIAAKMFNKSIEEIDKELRDKSKSTALGVGYGMGAHKLAVTQQIKHPRLPDGSYEYHGDLAWHMTAGGDLREVPCSEVDKVYCTCEGRKLIRWFFGAIPSMQPTIKSVIASMKRNGYIRFPLSGRVRRLEKFWNPDRKRMEDNAHKAWNALLQGTGADIMENAMIRIDETIPEERAKCLVTVHDSLLFEVTEGPGAREVCDEILRIMETTTLIDPVPLVADAKFGPNWSNMAKYARACTL